MIGILALNRTLTSVGFLGTWLRLIRVVGIRFVVLREVFLTFGIIFYFKDP